MKKYLLAIGLLFCLSANAQHKKMDTNSIKLDMEKMNREMDSLNNGLLESIKNSTKNSDSVNSKLDQERISRNMDAFMEMQRENNARQRKQMWIRLGLGVAFLGVLVFGIVRRRKKTVGDV